MNEILKLPDYDVVIGDCTESVKAFISTYANKKIIVLTDRNTHKHCLHRWIPILPADFLEITIPAGEMHKSLDTCGNIWAKLLEYGVNRNDLLINLGGGVIGDMGGFCASTYKRGIDFIQIPTTLLSMVDASIGGKLGIDFNGVKNSIGVFKDPKAVFVDPFFLETLSWRELRSGFAEIIKHALISDASQWQQIRAMRIHNKIQWQAIISNSLKVKQAIVLEDPFEKGRRKALNFGHTIGHGIEGVRLNTAEHLLHGEAIAIGMAIESWLSFFKGFISEDEFTAIFQYLKGTFDLKPIEEEVMDDMIALMRNDKKNETAAIHFSIIGPIGKVRHDIVFEESFLKKALDVYNHLLLV
jgi:3-dehydroquinate synthase